MSMAFNQIGCNDLDHRGYSDMILLNFEFYGNNFSRYPFHYEIQFFLPIYPALFP